VLYLIRSVSLMTERVKTRGYDSSRRRAEAAARRGSVLDAARSLFGRKGFAVTTVAEIAEMAGVSTELVYKQFGGKPGIVRELYTSAIAGEGPEPAFERSDRLRSEPDPFVVARGWSELAMEVGPRVAPLMLIVRDASLVDPTLKRLLAEMDAANHRRMSDNAHFLAAAGHLRPGVSEDQAADVLWSLTSPEMYELLVVRRGWTTRRWADFVYHGIASLLRPAS